MRRSNFVTEPLSCDVTDPRFPAPRPTVETEFEKRRGVSNVEVREGFAQVHVAGLTKNLVTERIRVLRAIADAEVSIDFLKLTPSGLSFIVRDDLSEPVFNALEGCEVEFTVVKDRSIVLVHAVNIRDEEGLIARIVQTVIASGAKVDHIGDMHDRMLLVLQRQDAERVARQFRRTLLEAA